MKKVVLFVDDPNSLESQIAELYLKQLYADRFDAFSAGISPTSINPYLYEAMNEEGIDVSEVFSKGIEYFKDLDVDIVVKIFEDDVDLSPWFSKAEVLHYNIRAHFVDRESDAENFAEIRKIKHKIKRWIKAKLSVQNASK